MTRHRHGASVVFQVCALIAALVTIYALGVLTTLFIVHTVLTKGTP